MRRFATALIGTAVVVLALTSCSNGAAPQASAPRTKNVHVKSTNSTKKSVDAQVTSVPTGSVLLATTHGSIPGYASAGGNSAATVSIPATWHGAVSTLPVIAKRSGWVDVRLAQRPNESTAWVRDTDVSLTSTPFQIVINLATTHLYLYRGGKLVFTAPAGVGTAADPTPTGHFFVAFFAAPPSSGYGPFVMVSSAHSNTISDWESSGDALMAIHGPLGADTQIGTTGAHVSHGCVRLHIADLVWLRSVPAGTPINVVAG